MPTMAQELKNIDHIFWDALQIDCAIDRAAYVARACGDDEQLRRLIEKLLVAQPRAGRFLEKPLRFDTTAEIVVLTEKPGTQIGPYRLLQQIGEGGFGVVFLADQTTPIRRKVALKIVKPGMDTRQVIARFEAERQALAMMDHTNIAKVYDAGATDNGRPYFAMELVHGVPITEYCDQCNLTTRERLELFFTVCQAVQHAHEKGVIHRDIKPTNVLVAMQDGRPAPKIIDFGIAKAIEQRLTEATLTTAFAQMIGSPLYMSPEQAELSALGVDTRSDIYSLGVLLYELLAGTTPFDKDRLHAASYDEMRRIVREEEPPKPSARISTLAADLATTVAVNRRTDPRRLSQTIRGDLDWIVMMAIEKNRNRRYETASALARDIQRFLRDEPVKACPPSITNRLRKYGRRNKVTLAFATLLACGLLYLGYSNLAIKRERDARGSALAQANAIAELLYEMLASASSSPDTIKGPDYTVRELLDDFSNGLGNRLADQPEVEAAIRTTIGKSYWRLGENETAELHLKKALDLRRQSLDSSNDSVATSLMDYAINLGDLGRFSEAESCATEAISLYKTAHRKQDVANALAEAYYFVAVAQLQRGDKAGYRDSSRKIVELPELSARIGDISNLARPVWTPCLAPNALDDMSLPIRLAEKLLAIDANDQRHFRLLLLGAALYRQGQFEQASQWLEESIAAYPNPPKHGYDTLNYQRLFLAMNRWRLGQRTEARQLLHETQSHIKEELKSPLTEWVRRATFALLLREAEAVIERDGDSESKLSS
jgi:non-specific serine/threonine protein kinase/serine/threonine-protein kinase